MPGPVGKRSTERHGHRTKAEQERTDTSAPGAESVTWPPVAASWCTPAKRWYRSLQTSGQAAFFEPSDVEAARVLAWALTQVMGAEKFSPTAFGEVWGAMGDLLTTEGARRRVRVELQKPEPGPAEKPPAVSRIEEKRREMEQRAASS